MNVNIEIFIGKQIDALQLQAASSRSKEYKDIHDACKDLKELLKTGEFGSTGSQLSIPFTAEIADSLICTLRSALALNNPKLSEPALACLHKLVAYAYLQGETRPSGRLDDSTSLVTQVVGMTAKAGSSTAAPVQLSVVKALLTLATAEHFVCHGDTLMQAVRTVFNIAVGGANDDIKNTARSALLQMLNTIVKRVAQQIITPGGTPMISPVQRFKPEDEEDDVSPPASAWLGESGSTAAAAAAAGPASRTPSLATHEEVTSTAESGAAAAFATAAAEAVAQVGEEHQGQQFGRENSLVLQHQSKLPKIKTPAGGLSPRDREMLTPTESGAGASAAAAQQQHLEDTRTAHLASLAEQADLRALEEAMVSLPSQNDQAGDDINRTPERVSRHQNKTSGHSPSGAAEGQGPSISTTAAASAAERTPKSPLMRVDTPPDPRRALMKERRAAEWRRLTVPERDAIIVINAMCKLAARETGIGAGETYMHVGKLLALEMLVKVLTNPAHDWSQLRREFTQQLRQPLCLALLRNCMSPYDAAVDAAVTILTSIVASPRLREFLKAEVGALYPLILLRPLEAEKPESPHQVIAALNGLAAVCTSPQVLVDIFVNYDCNLQAANLFERTIKLLAKYVQTPSALGPLPAAAVPKARAAALKALLGAIKSMDTWAGPLKLSSEDSNGDAVLTSGDSTGGAVPAKSSSSQQEVDLHQALSGIGGASRHLHHDVLQKIQTDKAIKSSLEVGVQLFNSDPMKGIKSLVESGAVGSSPRSKASFLRESAELLDPAAIGELLGHHNDESIAVMHAYIESENFKGLSVEQALRKLLFNFRLPGEAQKIDRIMEKFAERYCHDNPGLFPTADAPYLLAFAIIMLNTDCHNPMAEARISDDDFVTMCVYQTEGGEYEQILPTDTLRELYQKIRNEEIVIRKWHEQMYNAAGGGNTAPTKGGKRVESSRRARLAAAVGLGQLAAPFWAGASWDKQHGVDVERQRLLELTGQLLQHGRVGAMAQGSGFGGPTLGLWHAATHAEHARPMMQVCGPVLPRALSYALHEASTLVEAAAVLDGYEQAIRLSALLRLEHLCETLVSSLAAAAQLGSPAPPHTPQEAHQVAALGRLVMLGTCSEAGALGSAWVVLLRALSELEALKSALTPGSDASVGVGSPVAGLTSSTSNANAPRPTTSPTGNFAGSTTAGASTSSSSASSFLGRFFSRSSNDATGPGSTATVVSERHGRRGPLSVRAGPGMGAVLWAETAGASLIDKIFTASAELDGEAVLTFFRALAAVSQEELDPGVEGVPPRVYLLHRLVECSYANTNRIRMVWQRIWTVVSQHLVSAACHADPYIAMFAVDALRQLADKLLGRAELAGFTAQGDALRPLTAVLRCSDSSSVRELAVACVAHAVGAHARRIGGGWRAVIESVAVAAADPSPAVVSQALDVMAVVFAALYEDDGHTCLRECMGATFGAVSNISPAVDDLTPAAMYMVEILARRLAEASQGPPLSTDSSALQEAWEAIVGPLAAIARADIRPKEADTAAAVLFQVLQTHGPSFPPSIWPHIFATSIAPLLALTGGPIESSVSSGAATTAVQPSSRPASALPRKVTSTTMPLPKASAEKQSPEGLERVIRHATTHLPDLWALLAALPPASAAALLGSSLRLLRDYSESPNDAAASLGPRQIYALLKQAGPSLSSDGWAEVEAVLGTMVAIPREITLSFESPVSTDMIASATMQDIVVLRRRCRSSLFTIRCIGEMLQSLPGSIPAEVQLRLLTALGSAVDAAAELNRDEQKRGRLAEVLNKEEQALGGGSNLNNGGSASVGQGEQQVASSTAAAGLAAAVRAEAGIWDRPVLPALLRHEVEGGRLLLGALRRAAAEPAALDNDPAVIAALKKECEGKAVALALRIVSTDAEKVSSAPVLNGNNENRAYTAALTREALLALSQLPAEAWQQQRAQVFTQAAKLVCSPELEVRKAVQTLMRSQISHKLVPPSTTSV